jgi:hypothetical protein
MFHNLQDHWAMTFWLNCSCIGNSFHSKPCHANKRRTAEPTSSTQEVPALHTNWGLHDGTALTQHLANTHKCTHVMPYMKWLPSTQPAVPCDGLQQQ